MNIKTTIFEPKQEICVICNKLAKVTRRYKDEPYCGKCYPKWFPRKICRYCNQVKRIYLRDNICLDCEKKTNCVRCGKEAETFEIGKITRYGTVCKACSLYFKEEKTCFECGKLSRKVSRSPLAHHNESLCLSCYRHYGFATCKNCKRHRKIKNIEKQLCKKCDKQLISICPKCKNEMASGYGSICQTCADRKLLFNLIRLNVRLFHHQAVRIVYKKFIFWYIKKISVSMLLHKSNSYISFFIVCNDNWQKIPDYTTLVTYFKPNGLRKHLTILRWLQETNQITIDKNLKDDLAEIERIQSLLNKLSNSIPCIISYYKYLQQKYQNKKTSLKSIRLALQPTIDLMTSQHIIDYPKQEQLNNYLIIKTGQIAAITGFINHLKLKYNCRLKIDRNHIQKMKKKQLKKHYNERLAILYNKFVLNKKEQLELVKIVIYNLYNIIIKLPSRDNIMELGGMSYYEEGNKHYFLPKDIQIRLTQ